MTAIAKRLADYSEAWTHRKATGIAEHWSQEHFRFYKAEEVRPFMTDWADVMAYWQGNEAMCEKIRLTQTDVTEIDLPGPVRIAISKMHWDMRVAADAKDPNGSPVQFAGQTLGGDNQVLSLWHEGGGDLKLIGWSETPDAAALYVTDQYQHAVSADF